MISRNTPFVLLDDARSDTAKAAKARLYSDPVKVITARNLSEVEPALDRLSREQKKGFHAAGYMSYEAGLALENRLMTVNDTPDERPLIWFGLFRNYQEIAPDDMLEHLPGRDGAWMGKLIPAIKYSEYLQQFQRVKDYIYNGDIYQANLTFASHARYAGHPLALYAAIRGQAKAPYGGVIYDGANWMLSFSPELFFALKDGHITARPMKGTATRGADAAADEAAKRTLQSDPKQRAENLMIVDLLRNDLSRVAEPGSVDVPRLFHVETYPTVHQMTSTVTATLKDDLHAADILRRIFPCGSITGAPKIRAMEVINELESRKRGIYCGSMGRIDAPVDGKSDAAFNVAIRTLVLDDHDKTLSIGLGSGIVADSNGDEEWRECLAKGKFAKVRGHDVSATGPDEKHDNGAAADLIETMRFEPASGILRLEAHLERMKTSAAALEFEFDRHAARNLIQSITFHQEHAAKVRLMLSKSGAIAIELSPLPKALSEPVKAKLVPRTADASDYRLHHKTSDRRVYAAPGLPVNVHPVFVDSEGYITEGAIWSVFVERDGKLLTPPLSRGILPGVLRAELLASGEAMEADLRVEDLADGFMLGNSLRGLLAARQ